MNEWQLKLIVKIFPGQTAHHVVFPTRKSHLYILATSEPLTVLSPSSSSQRQPTENAYNCIPTSPLSLSIHHPCHLQPKKTMFGKLRFSKSVREECLPQAKFPPYTKPKEFKASTLKSRRPNDQAARLARAEKEAAITLDTDTSGQGGQVRHSRHFSFVGHADEDIVRRQNTTFEYLAKRGVIPKSALQPATKAER